MIFKAVLLLKDRFNFIFCLNDIVREVWDVHFSCFKLLKRKKRSKVEDADSCGKFLAKTKLEEKSSNISNSFNIKYKNWRRQHDTFSLTHIYINPLFHFSLISFSSYQLRSGFFFQQNLFSCALQYLVLLASGFSLIKHRQNLDYDYEKRETEDEMRWSVCDFEVLQYTT